MKQGMFTDIDNSRKILGTGFIALDLLLDEREPGIQRLYAGGTCGNVLTILSWLGWDSWPIARLKSDSAGERLIRDLKRWNVNTKLLRMEPQADTPIVVERLSVPKTGKSEHRFTWTCPSCGMWLPGYRAIVAKCVDKVTRVVPQTDVFFFDRVSRAAIDLAKWYYERGTWVVFEPSGMGNPKQFREALKYCHILKYSNQRMQELSGLTGTSAPLLQIETLGFDGLRYRRKDGSKWTHLQSLEVKSLVDTAGAGDWCTAGILHKLITKKPSDNISDQAIRSALELGQSMATWACKFSAPRGGMYESSLEFFSAEISHLLFDHELEINDLKLGRKKKAMTIKCVSESCRSKESSQVVK